MLRNSQPFTTSLHHAHYYFFNMLYLSILNTFAQKSFWNNSSASECQKQVQPLCALLKEKAHCEFIFGSLLTL